MTVFKEAFQEHCQPFVNVRHAVRHTLAQRNMWPITKIYISPRTPGKKGHTGRGKTKAQHLIEREILQGVGPHGILGFLRDFSAYGNQLGCDVAF